MTSNISRYADFIRDNIAAVMGFCFWWVFYFMIVGTPIYYSLGVSQNLDLKLLIGSFNEFSLISGSITGLCVALVSFRFAPFRCKWATFACAALLPSLGVIVSILPFLTGMGLQGTSFELVGGFMVGVGLSFLQIEWGVSFFSRTSQKEALFITAVAFLGSLLLAYVFVDTGLVGLLVAVVAPFVSVCLLWRWLGASICEEESAVDCSSQHLPLTAFPVKPFAVLMALSIWFGLAFGIFRMVLLPDGLQETSPSMHSTVLVCFFVGVIIVAIILCSSREAHLPLILVVSLLFVTLGVFSLSLFGVGGKGMTAAFSTGGVKCAELVTWMIAISLASGRSEGQAARVFGLWRAAGCSGALLGYISGRFLSSSVLLNESMRLSVSLLVLISLVVASFIGMIVFWDGRNSVSGEKSHLEQSSAAQGGLECISRDARMCDLAQSAGLSQRENEVFELLCMGRSASFIADKLVIAESTANTHIKRIYRKLGVHGKQELLDLLDG